MGLPVSWPLPTAVQEQGRPTGATAATNAAARKNVSAAPVGREVVGAELDAIKQPLDALMEAMAPAHDTAPMAVRKRRTRRRGLRSCTRSSRPAAAMTRRLCKLVSLH